MNYRHILYRPTHLFTFLFSPFLFSSSPPLFSSSLPLLPPPPSLVSPYLKSLSMITCARLMHLMEVTSHLVCLPIDCSIFISSLPPSLPPSLPFSWKSFSTPWFLFAKPTNHYLVFYLLEIFNNVIQYQFDGKGWSFLSDVLPFSLLSLPPSFFSPFLLPPSLLLSTSYPPSPAGNTLR